MLRRFIAFSVVAVWLVLFGIEVAEAAGFIDRVDKDRSVETETASFGVALRALDSSRLMPFRALVAHAEFIVAFSALGLCSLRVAAYLGKEARFLKGHFKIFKLHRVLLI